MPLPTIHTHTHKMYDCWKSTSMIAPVYFVSLILLGVFCALNLFLAILLLPFDGSDMILLSNRVHPDGESTREQPSLVWSKAITALKRLRDKFKLLSFGQSLDRYEYLHCQYGIARRNCEIFVSDKRFDMGLTAIIILSSITLAIDHPLRNPKSSMAAVLLLLNHIFTIIFVAECGTKLISHGPVKYAQDRWNILDFTTVVASVLELSNVRGGKTLRVLRAFRLLRPLKMINKLPEVKIVVDALLLSLPSVVDVGVVCALLFLIFSIFGVTYLKGTFYNCAKTTTMLTPEEITLMTYPKLVGELTTTELSLLDFGLEKCSAAGWGASKLPTSREICACLNGSEWVPTIPQNFDNVLNGFALLFEISTTER